MKEFRVTKYDPRHRDASGAYLLRDEWTEFSDVGRSVSMEDYLATEARYVGVAVALLLDAGVEVLRASGVENHRKARTAPAEGAILAPDQWADAFRSVLRCEWWCRFESESGFVHFGYDYYMFVGVERTGAAFDEVVSSSGLFLEPFPSPFHPEIEDEDS